MRDQLQRRLEELKKEFATGQARGGGAREAASDAPPNSAAHQRRNPSLGGVAQSGDK